MRPHLNPELEKVIKEATVEARQKLPDGHHAQTIVLSALQTLLVEGREKKDVAHLLELAEKIRKEIGVITADKEIDKVNLGSLGDMGMAVIREARHPTA